MPWALLLALVLLAADLLLLVLDLGDTWRFHHMLRVFKPRAPMSLGTWSLSLFGTALGLAALASVLRLLGGPGWLDWIMGAAVCLAVIPAVGSILYKGVLFSVTSQPGWQDARWLGGYTSNSAILLGCSLLLVLAAFAGQGEAAAVLRAALLGLLLLDVLFFFLFYRGIARVFRAALWRERQAVLLAGRGRVRMDCTLPAAGAGRDRRTAAGGLLACRRPGSPHRARVSAAPLKVRRTGSLADDLGAQLVIPLVYFGCAVRILLLAA